MTTAPSIIHLLDPEEPVIAVACCGCASRRDDLADSPSKVTCPDCLRALLGKWRPMVDAASARLGELTRPPPGPRPLDACPVDLIGSGFKP